MGAIDMMPRQSGFMRSAHQTMSHRAGDFEVARHRSQAGRAQR